MNCRPLPCPEVNIRGNRVSPTPSLRGGARFPPPAGEGLGGLRPPSKKPAGGEGLGGLRPPKNNNIFILALCGAAAWMTEVKIGNPGFPPLLFTGMPGAPTGGWGVGKPGFPPPWWENLAVAARRRRAATPSQEKPMFIVSLCGAAAWRAEVNIWRNQLSPFPAHGADLWRYTASAAPG